MSQSEDLAQKIAEVVEELASERGLSQNALAKKSGVSQGQISRIFTGKRDASLSQLFSIAHALGKSASGLFAEAEARLAEAEARASLDSDVSLQLPDDWEVSLAARRVDDSPESREDAFLDSLGEESQE
jgi:DNA-binding helix-turn-helix protein